ncbi:MAG: hypothetical protein M0R70_01095 [Nitrospirae bacterium]|nr:hypothetical protein [Nitrospirota bacterium]
MKRISLCLLVALVLLIIVSNSAYALQYKYDMTDISVYSTLEPVISNTGYLISGYMDIIPDWTLNYYGSQYEVAHDPYHDWVYGGTIPIFTFNLVDPSGVTIFNTISAHDIIVNISLDLATAEIVESSFIQSDLNGSGYYDSMAFLESNSIWGYAGGPYGDTMYAYKGTWNRVPETGTLLLLLSGIGGLIGLRKWLIS